MKADYHVHDRQYREARAQGWNGWGGNDRIAYGHTWLEHLFAYEGVPQAGEALELGCGEGHLTRLLAARGYSVLGVDVSAVAVEWAKEKTPDTERNVSYQVIDLTQPDVLLDRAFDLIVDGNCLHCIINEDRQTFLANVHRLLKADGLFFVYSKCSHATEDEVVEFEGKPYRYVPTEANLHRELKAAGFALKKSVFHDGREGSQNGHCTIHLTK